MMNTGRIVLDSEVVGKLQQSPAAVWGSLATFSESLFGQIARFISSQVPPYAPCEQPAILEPSNGRPRGNFRAHVSCSRARIRRV